ncbi:transposase [Rubrivirga sp.]|uniref:transposase n=1 Tax=Rubrivirga sp. TaxID=1885344 RepID=UPI003C741204
MRSRDRRSVRLRDHGYRDGLYAVTVCTWGRAPLFGVVLEGEVVLSAFGQIARDEWVLTGEMRDAVVLDAFVVMPDHVHLLFGIVEGGGHDEEAANHADTPAVCPYPNERRFGTAISGTVSSIMRQYKSVVTKRIRESNPAVRVWQGRFHDRIVLEAEGWRRYIVANPARWNPGGPRRDGHHA